MLELDNRIFSIHRKVPRTTAVAEPTAAHSGLFGGSHRSISLPAAS